MTESDARRKWCPMVRIANTPDGAVYNRDVGSDGNCIASDCACWVWDDPQPKEMPMSHKQGHCGLINNG